MSQTVGVLDGDAIAARAISAALVDGGFVPERVSDEAEFVRKAGREPSIVGIIAAVPSALAWDHLTAITLEDVGLTVVAILDDDNDREIVRALTVGASGAFRRGVSAAAVVSAFDLCLQGAQVMPVRVGRSLARLYPVNDPGPEVLDEIAIGWLRQLDQGSSISRLACDNHWSEGHMRRRVRLLCARMGVTSVPEAISRAQWWGVLEAS